MTDDATARDELDVDDEQMAKIVVLREGVGPSEAVENTDENRQKAQLEAARRKAMFLHMVKGAQARAGLLPRAMTSAMAAGATNLMLAEILHGNVVPLTAKEAAEVAKITNAIAKDVLGETPDNRDLTPDERAKKLETAVKLEETLRERAKAASDEALGGPARDGDQDLEFDHPEDVESVLVPDENGD